MRISDANRFYLEKNKKKTPEELAKAMDVNVESVLQMLAILEHEERSAKEPVVAENKATIETSLSRLYAKSGGAVVMTPAASEVSDELLKKSKKKPRDGHVVR